MATMALPIQTLSADIQVEAACAQKQIVRLRSGLGVVAWFQTRIIDYYCSKLMTAEGRLIEKLQDADFNRCQPAKLEELATDLDRIVSLTMAVIEKGYELPVEFSNPLKGRFDRLEELASHIDSFAESFHMAADSHCEGMLALAAAEQTLERPAV